MSLQIQTYKNKESRMGIIKSKEADNLPKQCSYQNTKLLISQLNTLCKQNAKDLGFTLNFRTSQLQYHHSDWKKSIVPGTAQLATPNKPRVFNIHMNLKAIYQSHQLMKHFQKKLSDSVLRTPCDSSETPNQECCICMDKTATMMLPCYHVFCASCTQLYIIDKEEKRCPVCRAEFEEDSTSLKRKIITIVGDEQSLVNDVRQILMGYLNQLNSHQVRQIEKLIGQPQNKQGKAEDLQEIP